MANKITDLRKWRNGETFNARDYVYERDLIVSLINNHEDRITSLESFDANLDDKYLDKVTTNAQEIAGVVDFTQGVNLEGRPVRWNNTDFTFDIQLLGDTTLQLGQEMLFPAKAIDNVTNGIPTMFAGAEGDHLKTKIVNTTELLSFPAAFMGVATLDRQEALDNFVYITTQGMVREVPLSLMPTTEQAWIDWVDAGDIDGGGLVLWINPNYNGANSPYTVVEPPRGSLRIRVAAVVDYRSAGENQYVNLYVRPSILEADGGGIETYLQDTIPTDWVTGDLWFDTGGE